MRENAERAGRLLTRMATGARILSVSDARPLFLALAIEAAPLGVVRLARPAWRKSAYVTTLVVNSDWANVKFAVPASADTQNAAINFFFRRH
jgi:hypothetical protein